MHEHRTGTTAPAHRPGSPALAHPPLTGREDITDLLRRFLLRPVRGGLAIAGGPGSGRTRLLYEAAALASTHGMRPVLLHPDDAPVPEPLRALAIAMGSARLPVPGRPEQAAAVLAEESRRRPLLIGVDDAQWLDRASAAVLRHLLDDAACRVVLAVPAEADTPRHVAGLWRDGRIDRVPLQPLGHGHTTAVCSGLLPRPVQYATAARLAALADGNLTHLRELAADAVESGALVLRHGQYVLSDSWAPSHRAANLIHTRLAGLSRPSRTALEYLCLSGVLPLATALRLADDTAWEDLEHRGMVRVHATDPFGCMLRADPLAAHTLTPRLPALRRRRLLTALLAELDDDPVARTVLRVRHAAWRAELGLPLGEEELMRAANTAWWSLDWSTALRLARHAWQLHRTPRTAHHYRSLLSQLGDPEEADAPSDEAVSRGAGTSCRRSVPEPPAGGGTPAAAGPGVPHRRSRVRPAEPAALVSTPQHLLDIGNCAQALAAAEAQLDHPDPARVAAVGGTALRALLRMGRPQDCLALGPRLHRATARAADSGPAGPDTSHIPALLALALARTGRPAEAIETLRTLIRTAAHAANATLVTHTAVLLADLLAEHGHLTEAHRIYSTAVGTHPRTRRLARSGALETAVRIGSPEGVRAAAQHFHPHASGGHDHRASIAQAAHDLFHGRRQAAATTLHTAGRHAARQGALAPLARIVHELTRIGHFTAATDLCGDWTRGLQSPLDRLRIDFAHACATASASAAADSAAHFEQAGTPLYAAEAWAVTWRLHQHAGETRQAAAAAQRGTTARRRHEGRATFLLDAMETAEPLSAREREVALLAAAGHTNQEIARQLTLSHRTIDRHLSSAYRKLGLTSRRELPDALDHIAEGGVR